MVMQHPEGSIGWYEEGVTPKWRDASLEQIKAFESGSWSEQIVDDGMGDFIPDSPSATFWVVPETSPNIDYLSDNKGWADRGNWWEPVATVVPSGETDLAGETPVIGSWMEDEAPGVIQRAFEYQIAGGVSLGELNPPQVVPEIPSFGGAYESPAGVPYGLGVPQQPATETPFYFGMPGQPGDMPIADDFESPQHHLDQMGQWTPGITQPGDPDYWGAYPGAHGEGPWPWSQGWQNVVPEIDVPNIEMPNLMDLGTVVAPVAGLFGQGAEEVKEKVEDGLDFMQLMMLMMVMKD